MNVTSRLSGVVLIINTFLPIAILLIVIGVSNALSNSLHKDACHRLSNVSTSFEKIEKIGNEKDLADFYKRVTESPDLGEKNGLPDDCDVDDEFTKLITNDFYERTKDNVNGHIASIGGKIDGVKKTVSRAIPTVPNINLKPVKLRIDIDALKIHVDIGKPINGVINVVNAVDDNINRALSKLANKIGGLFSHIVDPERKRIYLEILKSKYRQAVLWQGVKGFLGSFAEALESYFWLVVGLVIWIGVSYLFWAHNRLVTGWRMVTGRQVVVQ